MFWAFPRQKKTRSVFRSQSFLVSFQKTRPKKDFHYRPNAGLPSKKIVTKRIKMNIKKQISLAYLIFLNICVFAQNDSINFATAKNIILKIDKNTILKKIVFNNSNLYNANQNISILEIKRPKSYQFRIAFNQKNLETTSTLALNNRAVAAINGNFFDTKRGGSVDFLKVNNQIVCKNQLSNGFRNFHQKAAIVIKKGKIFIEKYNHFNDWEMRLSANNIMVSGPLLVFNNNLEYIDESAFNKNRHPRSVLAITKSNHVLMITIDGRHANAAGMSLHEVQKILSWLEVKSAINLDGGGSTTLFVAGQLPNGIVNYPCDNKTWDHFGERNVANIIFLTKKN